MRADTETIEIIKRRLLSGDLAAAHRGAQPSWDGFSVADETSAQARNAAKTCPNGQVMLQLRIARGAIYTGASSPCIRMKPRISVVSTHFWNTFQKSYIIKASSEMQKAQLNERVSHLSESALNRT